MTAADLRRNANDLERIIDRCQSSDTDALRLAIYQTGATIASALERIALQLEKGGNPWT